MKPILPWALVVVLGACCVRLYLTSQKAEPSRTAVAADTGRVETLIPTEPKSELQTDAAKAELLQLRKENADLLRLRNEVRRLREENAQKEVRLKAVSRDLQERMDWFVTHKTAEKVPFIERQQELGAVDDSRREIAGIGVILTAGSAAGSVEIRQVFAGSPAARAGIGSGDRLISVNGVTPANATLAQIVEAIRGDEGSSVMIEFEDVKQGQSKSVTMFREKIVLKESPPLIR